MSILRHLFRKKTPPPSLRQDFVKVMDNAIAGILLMNFTMLEWAPFSCSLDGPAGSKKAREYLIGLGEAIIMQFQSMNPTQEEAMAAMSSAFGFVFGEANAAQAWPRLLDTIDEFHAGDVEVMEGATVAHQDVQEVYAGGPHPSPMGFWHINQFEKDATGFPVAPTAVHL